MHPLIEKYGKEIISELLDIILIEEGKGTNWSWFLKKHGILANNSRATVYGTVGKSTRTQEYRSGHGFVALDEPTVTYTAKCRNGRNELLFRIKLKEEEIQQMMEDLK